ncbi:SusC/RagA family TonB-linked outer membrane protein [Pontibacter sp. SGAir0037]|uniref:SusC/RagA family TonB-linked outer membrane protein n=1 Tax=Pontibacter sp. SGAir0037 TaxID=2571030 RepID=UPI001F0CF0DC|nr:SusC/RagA family TonB-linked outer membrane protein [Pontibacter sp. SGAir0037]
MKGKGRILGISALSLSLCTGLSSPASAARGENSGDNSLISAYTSLPDGAVKRQEMEVKGRITDKTGGPLPGASVSVKGTTTGTVTNANGEYTISVPSNTSVLVISYIGFITQEVPVNSRASINVVLAEDAAALSEVVVVGYGSQRREEITSAVSNVTQEDFRQSGARNALDLVQGKIPGLAITRTGGSNPNSGVNIQLRGAGSVSASTAPLIVIDGIPGGNLDLLQQDDIESISVLRDGSAAAIYGTRANGGVILVTTKKGKPGQARFDYNTYFRREYVRDRADFMNADQYRQKIAEGLISATNDYGHSTDFYDLLINKSNLSQYHNMQLSGGGDNTNYSASVYYQDLQGIAKENGRKQYGGRINLNHSGLNDRLTAQLILSTNFNNANLLGGGGWEGSLIRNPTQSVYNPDGSFYFEQTSTNEVARLEQETNRRQQQTTAASASVGLELMKGLKASMFAGVQRNSYIDGAYRELASEYSLENDIFRGGGYASRNTFLGVDYVFEPTIQFDRILANNHHINAVGGYSYQYAVSESFNAFNLGFVNDVFRENNIGTGNQLGLGKAGMGSSKADNTLIAFFGRFNYSFMDKYMLSLIYRREGSSRFGANNKWGDFPAVSAGWNISKESFMESVTFVNNLKLRAGFGVTGNQGFSNYVSLVTLGGGGLYINPDGVWRQTYGPDKNPNPDLKWERKGEFNAGIDFSVLNNRLSGTIDVFKRNTTDLVYNYTSQLPPFIRETITTNVGEIANKGIEIGLSAVAIKKNDFRWNIDATASTVSNKFVTFSNDIYKQQQIMTGDIGGYGALGNAIRLDEGGAVGNFYGARFAGFDENGKWLFYKRDGSQVPFSQLNRSIDPNVSDLAIIGNGMPKYLASMTHDFGYKNWGLRVFLRGRFDYDILNRREMAYGNKTALPNNLLNSAFTRHAQLNDTYQYSDYYLEPGDHVKLDEVTLSYNFKLNTSYIRNLRLYATGANLATFTKYTGNDPDFVSDTGLAPGMDTRDPYPNTRSILVGLNVGF